jgi:hypothetical protein
MVTGATTINAVGTDGNDACPDDESYPALPNAAYEYTANANVASHWFWIELNSGMNTATIKHGDNPATVGWSSWDSLDGFHIPIGYVDTRVQPAVIRQLLRADWMGALTPCPP